MEATIERKCACCKNGIAVERGGIKDVVLFKGKYYHMSCFRELASRRSQTNRGKPEEWRNALENIAQIERETIATLERQVAFHELNVWLLENYDISVIPSRFYQVVNDLERGKYKGKMCKPIDVVTLCDCWKWGQRKLDEISVYNKSNHKGPASDADRIMYDLAVLVGKVPQYLVWKSNHEAAKNEIIRESKKVDEVDMRKVGQGAYIGKQDLSSISSDLFVE